MSGAEAQLHSKKDGLFAPCFREKLRSLVQPDPVNRNSGGRPPENISRQIFGRYRLILQAGDFLIQIFMIEFGTKRIDHSIQVVVWYERT